MDKKHRDYVIDGAAYLLGSAFYAISLNVFAVPNQIASGGVTGISQVMHHFFGLPIGVMIIVINIPLFILATRKIGLPFLYRTILATVLTSVLTDLSATFLPEYTEDKILAALFGGVFMGMGLAFIFLRGGTTGGTDLTAKLLQLRWPHLAMGRIMLIIDMLIIAGAAVAFGNIESVLYSMILLFVCSKAIDSALSGADRGKLVLVISNFYEVISNRIMEEVGRGVTLLNGTGAYKRTDNKVILCAVRLQEVSKVHRLVHEIDPDAFLITADTSEVLGEGFKPLKR